MLLRAPGAPYWLGIVAGAVSAPIVGVLLGRTLAGTTADLLFARVGTTEERRARLAIPQTRWTPLTSRAALALETGELSQAATLLGRLPNAERRQPLFVLVSQRKLFLTGDPATQARAIDALLAWRPRLRFGVHAELARYHAYALATALATRAADDPQLVAATKRLRESRDPEVRGYATWLTNEGAPPELLAGAALARAAAREPLAQSLELRAARDASALERGPYRDTS